ncbi:phosphoglycerate kinase, cytosolic-like isoform X2 [Papaver somniferum]|uniref:phosphoglycerate kinase, cytosolic-like isoform X2 n=1 Tax=Papaver somniferum TaxID=3469 RepID=UPI000E70175D|nr:phosphoglycerate kinase, cytosolic-like isoform X2 [Papaver somniferum]
MSQHLKLAKSSIFLHDANLHKCPLLVRPCFYYWRNTVNQRCQVIRSSVEGCYTTRDSTKTTYYEAEVWDGEQLNTCPHVQTLRQFPRELLSGKIVMVRFDSTPFLREALDYNTPLIKSALFSIKYLLHHGAKVLIVSDWGRPKDSTQLLSAEIVADKLSSALQLKVVPANWVSVNSQFKMEEVEISDVLLFENLSKFKEERANSSMFAEKLSSGVDIFVNDTFSQSHKVLASTVGVSRYCYASIAGFCFEKQLEELVEIGGGNLHDKVKALEFLASKCDGLVFVGMMAFQIMHGLGLPVRLNLVELSAVGSSLKIIQIARGRNIPILLPKDFWCTNMCNRDELRTFTANDILDGWEPVDLGPVSLDEISSLLTNCKKILWIGPVRFMLSRPDTHGASKLATMVETSSRRGCDVTVVGNAACKAIAETSSALSLYSLHENASVVWEFLKGRTLPGIAALDRAYPFDIDWKSIFRDPTLPLIVDIGSGNGLFIFGMARIQPDVNLLGLEINKKVVKRCLDFLQESGLKNSYFIATNATSTFRSIVSSYPGKLVLVSIQCPNPDFNRPEYRWRMLQTLLIEAIAGLLATEGKVFIQSDVEAVAVRMRDQFMKYSESKLAILKDETDTKIDSRGWIEENPFGVQSDWERHVIERGDPMYRLMISKID